MVSYCTKTRSGRVFSPYVPDENVTSIVVDVDLDELVLRAVEVERQREECGADDADGATLEALSDTFTACTLSQDFSVPTAESQPTSESLAAPSLSQASHLNLQSNIESKRSRPRKRTTHSKKMKTQARAAARRNLKASSISQYRVSSPTRRKLGKPFTFQSFINANTLPAAKGAWVGKNIEKDVLTPPNRREPYTLEECMSYGCRLIQWDGM
jgi:hypothetical protein